MLLFAISLTKVSAQEVDARDVKRLAVKEQQDALFSKYGEYSQIKRDATFDTTLGEEQFVLAGLMDGSYEVHVYDAPCGKGWTLLYYEQIPVYATTTGKLLPYTQEVTRSVGHGCQFAQRTVGW